MEEREQERRWVRRVGSKGKWRGPFKLQGRRVERREEKGREGEGESRGGGQREGGEKEVTAKQK